MVATSGDLLIERNAVSSIVGTLVPLATLVTPNSDEAAVLAGFPVDDLESMKRAALEISRMGAGAVLVKGGHVRGAVPGVIIDLLYDGEFTEYRHARLETRNTHGTGCTLSAAIAAELAKGATIRASVQTATDFVFEAMRTAPDLGGGHGPLNHFAAGSAPTKSFMRA
jgi:hydroxymethylpyrimidine/phosphomethylpyrimidine kinase